MPSALVSLGANLGDRLSTLNAAVAEIDDHPQVRLVSQSSWRETAPVGGPVGQPAFLNGAVCVETELGPRELLRLLLDVEHRLGRQRETRWDARTIDLDLLLYDDLISDDPELTLPHPRMAYRRFVLEPAAEAAPGMLHPLIGWSVQRLLEHLNTAPNYLAITGLPGAGKTRLAEQVAAVAGAAFCRDPRAEQAERRAPNNARSNEAEAALVRIRAEAVRRHLAQSPDGVVSDFWIEQSRVYAERGREGFPAMDLAATESHGPENPPDPEARSVARWDAGAPAKSKTLALLNDAPPAKLVAFLSTPESLSPAASRLQAELRRLATRPGRGPYLVLSARNLDTAAAETIAAVLAMR